MKVSVRIGFYIILIITCGAQAELITLGVFGAVSSLSGYLTYKYRCSYMECCDDNEIPYNTNGNILKVLVLIYLKYISIKKFQILNIN